MQLKTALRRVFRSPFTPLYDEARLPSPWRRGLLFVIFGNLCGNIFGTITTGSSLTGYAGALGANDFVFGVLTAIPFIGTLMQIPASILVSKTGRRKRFLLTFGIVSRAMWIIVGLIPFFIPLEPTWLQLWSVIFLVCISSMGGSFINVSFNPWLADLVPIRIRGRWISCRDRIISVIGIAIGLGTALILDHVPGFPGYAIVFVFGGITGVMDMLAFIFVKEEPPKPSKGFNLPVVLKQIVNDKPFFRFMMFWTAWCFTANLSGPYINRYALGDLGLSFVQVTLFGQVAAALITVVVISRWGRLIDQYGSKPVLWISCVPGALTPLFFLFSVAGNPVTYFLHNVVGAAFWSASNLTATNMQLSYSPDEQRPTYIAIFSSVTSIAGAFCGVLLGGAMLQWLPGILASLDITVNGQPPDQYKILFTISCTLRLAIVLLMVPGLKNDREATTADLFTGLRERIGAFRTLLIKAYLRARMRRKH
jgi:MFS family permease